MSSAAKIKEVKGLREDLVHRLVDAAPSALIAVDSSGQILLVNSELERLFGYTRDDLLGKPVESLLPQRYRHNHKTLYALNNRPPSLRSIGTERELRAGGTERDLRAGGTERELRAGGTERELCARRKDGTEFPVEIALNRIQTADGPLLLGSIYDITERKRVEEQLKASLRAKETLIREIHHRLKNNLAVISSLLGMAAKGQKSRDLRSTLEESQQRVYSIALIHEHLYGSESLDQVDFSEYAGRLIPELHAMFAANPDAVRVRTKLAPIEIGIQTAIPCGLILNELLTNAFKYAFPASAAGSVTVEVRETSPGQAMLSVEDDGIGMPEDFDWKHVSKSFGLQVVKMLTKQIGGSIKLIRRPGARFEVRFPVRRDTEASE